MKKKIMFQFIFQGTEEQFQFFLRVVEKQAKIKVELEYRNPLFGDEFHCIMPDEPRKCFEVGMICAACYVHFGHKLNPELGRITNADMVSTTCVRCGAGVFADRYKNVYCDRCIDDWIAIPEEE